MPSDLSNLLKRIAERARDPARATDNGHGIFDSAGQPVLYVANPPLHPELFGLLEQQWGTPLPALLRRLYTEVGDGGFGPGYGLQRLEKAMELSLNSRQLDNTPEFASGRALRLCEWGCAIRSYLDDDTSSDRVLRMDPTLKDYGPAMNNAVGDRRINDTWLIETTTLDAWLHRWLAGEQLFYTAYGMTGSDDPRLQC